MMPEYRVDYITTPTKKEPFNHYTFQWLRIFNLPDARKRAMWLINHNKVVPNTVPNYYYPVSRNDFVVELSKDMETGTKIVGAVIKHNGEFYWTHIRGTYHIINPDGSVRAGKSAVDLPKVFVKKRRN